MPYKLIVSEHDEAPPVPENKPRVVESPLWGLLKDLQAGKAIDVNRTDSHIRGMISRLAAREKDPEERKAVKARRYKVRQINEETCTVWRLK